MVETPIKWKNNKEDTTTLKALFTFLSVMSYICLNVRISFGHFNYLVKFPCDEIEHERGEEEFMSTYICVNLWKTQKT
jgi:hypothetical protein